MQYPVTATCLINPVAMTKTEIKQLRKAKVQAEVMKRIRTGKSTYASTTRQKAHALKRIAERLHFLVKEGRKALWFRKRGLPEPTAENVRADLIALKSH